MLSFSVVALGVADCSQMLSYEEAAESGKEAVNTFGLRLLAGLSRRGRANGGNALISPASVAAALGMAAAGATTGSDAHLELEGALMGISLKQCNGSTVLATALLGGTKSSEGSGVDISVANSGWFDASVLQSYKVRTTSAGTSGSAVACPPPGAEATRRRSPRTTDLMGGSLR